TTSTGSRHCRAGIWGAGTFTTITVDPSSSFVNPVSSTDHTGQFVDESTFCTPLGPVFATGRFDTTNSIPSVLSRYRMANSLLRSDRCPSLNGYKLAGYPLAVNPCGR